MDALAFLRLVVPTEGIKYLGISTQGGRPKHYSYDYFEPMAEASAQFSLQRKDVYFALASYSSPVQATDREGKLVNHPDGQPKMLKRTAALAYKVKAFWADLDCGEGKPYATQADAIADVTRFVEASGVATPLLVNSGGGVHAYWPLSTSVPAAAWQGWAKHWRSVLHFYGLKSDPARDMDVASILRVPDTSNNKRSLSRPVAVLQEAGASDTRGFFTWLTERARLAKPIASKAVARNELGAVPVWLLTDDADNSDLSGHGSPKASAVEASKHCAQLRIAASMAGNVDEPVWRAMLGVVKHSSEGDALAHEWSKGHPAYDEAETQDKLDRWAVGPSTCAHFEQINPKGCEGCPHKKRVTSPIQLGTTYVEKQVVHVEDSAGNVDQVEEIVLPPGFIWDEPRSLLCRQVRGDDGIVDNIPFSQTLWHGVTRIRQLDSTYQIRMRSHHKNNVKREFTVPTAEVNVVGESLLRLLGSYEVLLCGRNEKVKNIIHEFLSAEVKRCESEGREVVTFDQFGWHDEGKSFLMGTKLFRQNPAETVDVLPSPGLKTHTEIGAVPNASAALWADAVAQIYGAPGAEPLQYAIASSFGSPLADLFGDDFHGSAVCLSGRKTGQGKTTACWTGLSIWGRPSQMMYANREGATFNARIARHSRYKNLPILHDELSQFSPDEAMQLLYAMANGRGRARLDQTGETEREPRRWKMSGYLTTNRPINELIALAKGGLLATVVRNFEINLDDYEIPKADLRVVNDARTVIESNAGAAGEKYAQFIVSERDAIKDMILSVSNTILLKAPELGTDTRFRLYRMHLEATIMGAILAQRLGLFPFDIKALTKWAIAHTRKLVVFAKEAEQEQEASPIERMFSDLSGQTIMTEDYRDGRHKSGPERLLQPLRGAPIARFVRGCPGMDPTGKWAAGRLMVTVTALRAWAAENHMSKAQLLRKAQEGGYLTSDKSQLLVLTRGTGMPGGQERCFVFDLNNTDVVRALDEKLEAEKGADDESA